MLGEISQVLVVLEIFELITAEKRIKYFVAISIYFTRLIKKLQVSKLIKSISNI